MDRRLTTLALAVTQMIHWGVSYYLIGVFGTGIAAETGWSHAKVYAGFSLALLAMGAVSSWAGRLIDRRGGRLPMAGGALLAAVGCLILATTRSYGFYLAAWTVLGLAMRLTLYDAAFASLARAFGREARRPISQVTLLGGLASTVFWPLGGWLAANWGWRTGVAVYAAVAFASIPLFLTLPRTPARLSAPAAGDVPDAADPAPPPSRSPIVAGVLYAFTQAALNFLNGGMSAYMIVLLQGLGLALPAAVGIAALRGIGQSTARLGEVLFGARVNPLDLHLWSAAAFPLSFAAGIFGGAVSAAGVFTTLYGISNGLMSITRGTLPLVLFDPRRYGTIAGRLLTPGFLLAALAPTAFAAAADALGPQAVLGGSAALALLVALAAWILRARFRRA